MADTSVSPQPPYPLPRVTIQFCTQCKWMLRAAYYAQELLSTFSTALGEVALQPSTGGTFVVTIFHLPQPGPQADNPVELSSTVLWDRKVDGGFPETKELKRRVRDVVEPGRDLGHVDRGKTKRGDDKDKEKEKEKETEGQAKDELGKSCDVVNKCEDCN